MIFKFKVEKIKATDVKVWFTHKHYAHRIPSISYCYGLFDGESLVGVCTFGKPESHQLCKGCCGEENAKYVYELNRLCVNDKLEKNVLSWFLGQCFKLLPKPLILVSYADTAMNHHGYIYQATNWIYTGATKARTDINTGGNKHSRHYAKGNVDYSDRKPRSSKHRYFYFLGNKREVNYFKKCLKYPIYEYPKGDNSKYDASFNATVLWKNIPKTNTKQKRKLLS